MGIKNIPCQRFLMLILATFDRSVSLPVNKITLQENPFSLKSSKRDANDGLVLICIALTSCEPGALVFAERITHSKSREC